MQKLDLSVKDRIHLLISGIPIGSLRATALTFQCGSVEDFLEKIRPVTDGMLENEKKSQHPSGSAKLRHREDLCKNCGKKGHSHKECKNDVTCFLCKAKGHRQFDCPKTKKRTPTRVLAAVSSATLQVAAGVSAEDTPEIAAAVTERTEAVVLKTNGPTVRISRIADQTCELEALIDTGSPVSFIKASACENHVKLANNVVETLFRKLRALGDNDLEIAGTIRLRFAIESLGDRLVETTFYILKENSLRSDVILGREFLDEHKLTLVYEPNEFKTMGNQQVNLFNELPICISEDIESQSLVKILAETETDFGNEVKQLLIETILEIENKKFSPIDDNYTVSVRIKDPSIYAYAPHRFAYAERIQIREITDDLLNRGIIRPSTSPYCARIVPVKKKNGKLRLCVDLRPLNNRIEKQKFPFPIIEDCLAQLSGKTIFTLLDLRDGFHQIKVEEESMKYFVFSTPDGQFEYTRLPFGYSEAPAEFQKRVIKILNPFIREGRVIVYIDDILILTTSVEENLKIMEKVIELLKSYGFEINYAKCNFLRTRIEFLGYSVSSDTLQ